MVYLNRRIENWKSGIENLDYSQSTKISQLKSQTFNPDLNQLLENYLFIGDV